MKLILHSYDASSLIFSQYAHSRKGGRIRYLKDAPSVENVKNSQKINLDAFRMTTWKRPPFRTLFSNGHIVKI